MMIDDIQDLDRRNECKSQRREANIDTLFLALIHDVVFA